MILINTRAGGVNGVKLVWDAILIKDNHIAVAGGISAVLTAARMWCLWTTWTPRRCGKRSIWWRGGW